MRLLAIEKSQVETSHVLRGKDDEIGLVGRVQILWRSWYVVLTFAGAVVGYITKSVVDKL